MAMQSQVVVLFANPYRVKDEDSGKVSEGISISYIYGQDFSPIRHENGSMGQRPAKGTLPVSFQNKISSVPGLYDGSFEMSIGSDGKPTLKLSDVAFVAPVRLVQGTENF